MSGDWGVIFPDFPGCVSAGDTIDEALTMAMEALALHVGAMREDGDPVPEPGSFDALPDWLGEIDNAVFVRTLVPLKFEA